MSASSPPRLKVERRPYVVAFQENAAFKDTYGGEEGFVFVECMQVRPCDRPSKTAIVFSHPIGGGSFLPIMGALARAGHHVVYVNTRYRGNDTALVMEKCVVDLGRAIRDLRDRHGYERFVLGGWSGGGSLALFYQEQAVAASITETPAGDPIDLASEQLIPGDALLLVAAHVSRAATLTEWMDPSIVDESRPFERDAQLNLYDPTNPHVVPYDADYLERYRKAQVARNRRITDSVREQLSALRRSGEPHAERAFVVYGTMADPRWLDPTVDPNGRTPGRCYLGDPQIVNDGPVGLARFTTLRSWMSQWSLDATNAHGVRNGAAVHVPALVVGNGADDACTPSHTERLFSGLATVDKGMVTIDGATHYYAGQREQLGLCVAEVGAWLNRAGFDE